MLTFNYIGTRKRCGACLQKAQCTSAPFRSLIIHQHESARQRARELAKTEEFAKAQPIYQCAVKDLKY